MARVVGLMAAANVAFCPGDSFLKPVYMLFMVLSTIFTIAIYWVFVLFFLVFYIIRSSSLLVRLNEYRSDKVTNSNNNDKNTTFSLMSSEKILYVEWCWYRCCYRCCSISWLAILLYFTYFFSSANVNDAS